MSSGEQPVSPGERPGSATGRRSNGLAAASWTAVGDVDPRQAGDLLAALAERGIAAYVTPSTGSVGAYLGVQLPARPLDRLHVDASRRAEAVALVRDEVEGERPESDEDAAFAAIVAGWDAPPAHPVDPWPVDEDLDPGSGGGAGSSTVVRGAKRRDDGPPATREANRGDSADAADEDARPRDPAEEEHYVAPPPPPLPRWQRPTLVCVLAIVVGLAVLGWASFGDGASDVTLLAGVLFIAGGAVGLISRMRAHHDDDGWDDGAVV